MATAASALRLFVSFTDFFWFQSSKMTVGLNPPYDALRWSFRDTLLAGYRSAYYRLANDVPSCSPEVFHGMRSLVNLSLSVVTN